MLVSMQKTKNRGKKQPREPQKKTYFCLKKEF